MQLLSGVGTYATALILEITNVEAENLFILALVLWLSFSFTLTFIIALFYLRNDFSQRHPDASGLVPSVLWVIIGVFLTIFVQTIAITIESWFGIEAGSENTEQLLSVIAQMPQFVIVIIILGPVLEEIVFRKIIFSYLYDRYNIWISALLSACIFALAHMELEHFILYTGIGLVFTFLYYKTKRILVPIAAHILMNAFVVIDSFFF